LHCSSDQASSASSREPPVSTSGTSVWYWLLNGVPTTVMYDKATNEIWCNGDILQSVNISLAYTMYNTGQTTVLESCFRNIIIIIIMLHEKFSDRPKNDLPKLFGVYRLRRRGKAQSSTSCCRSLSVWTNWKLCTTDECAACQDRTLTDLSMFSTSTAVSFLYTSHPACPPTSSAFRVRFCYI